MVVQWDPAGLGYLLPFILSGSGVCSLGKAVLQLLDATYF